MSAGSRRAPLPPQILQTGGGWGTALAVGAGAGIAAAGACTCAAARVVPAHPGPRALFRKTYRISTRGFPAPCPCGQTGNAALLAMASPGPLSEHHARPSATSKLNSEEFEYSTRFPQDRGKKIARFLVCPVRNRPG